MKRAVFAGSFDPFTIGHQEVVEAGLKIFDEVVVAIGENSKKTALFSIEERIKMIRECCSSSAVSVTSFKGLVVDFAKQQQAMALLRGLRTESDFSYEMPMAMTNRMLAQHIDTVFVPTTTRSQYVSSTLVREIAYHGGPLDAFVPQVVLGYIQAKFIG